MIFHKILGFLVLLFIAECSLIYSDQSYTYQSTAGTKRGRTYTPPTFDYSLNTNYLGQSSQPNTDASYSYRNTKSYNTYPQETLQTSSTDPCQTSMYQGSFSQESDCCEGSYCCEPVRSSQPFTYSQTLQTQPEQIVSYPQNHDDFSYTTTSYQPSQPIKQDPEPVRYTQQPCQPSYQQPSYYQPVETSTQYTQPSYQATIDPPTSYTSYQPSIPQQQELNLPQIPKQDCALSQQNKMQGSDNLILGSYNQGIGDANIICGQCNCLSGNINTCVGDQNIIQGDKNELLGDTNVCHGDSNTIQGCGNLVSGSNNIVMSLDSFNY